MAGKLGDLPTMKVEPGMLEEYARRADQKAAEITLSDEAPTKSQTAMRPAARTVECVSLEAVPVVSVSREDLAWFQLAPDAQAVLEKIDGRTTVAQIIGGVTVAPDRVLAVLGELEVERIISLA